MVLRDGLEARGEVDGVADRRVLEALLRAERADDRLARVDPDAVPDRDAVLRLPARRRRERPFLEREPGPHGLDRVLGVLDRDVVEGHHAVADVLVDGAVVREDDLRHLGEVLAQHGRHLLGFEPLGDGGEAAQVGEEDGDQTPTRAQAPLVTPADDRPQDVRREEAREPPLLALLAHEVLEHGRAVAQHEGERGGHAAQPEVAEREAGEGAEREGAPHEDRGAERAQRPEAQHERRAQHGGDERDARGDPPGDLADRVAGDQRVEGVGEDLDSGHLVDPGPLAAAREGGGEQVFQDRARRAHEDDLAAEGRGPDLAAQHLVVRHPRKRPRAAAEVDEDLWRVGQRLDGQARLRGDPMERGSEAREGRVTDADPHRHAPDQAVGVVEDVDRRIAGRAPPDDRQRRVDVHAAVEGLLVHPGRVGQHHVARPRDGRAEGLVVLGSARRRRVEDEVDADRERPARADPVEQRAVHRAGKRPLRVQLGVRGLVDRHDDDRRARRPRAPELEEPVERPGLEGLEQTPVDERDRDRRGADAAGELPGQLHPRLPESCHCRHSTPQPGR